MKKITHANFKAKIYIVSVKMIPSAANLRSDRSYVDLKVMKSTGKLIFTFFKERLCF